MKTLLLAVLVSASAARAEGFFLRPEVGASMLRASADNGGSSSVSGAQLGVTVGGWMGDSVALGGRLSWLAGRSSLLMAGPELTVRAPLGLDVSAGVGVTTLFLAGDARAPNGLHPLPSGPSTNMGLGASVALGRQWKAGPHLGLGLMARASVSQNEDRGWAAPTWTSKTLGLSALLAWR